MSGKNLEVTLTQTQIDAEVAIDEATVIEIRVPSPKIETKIPPKFFKNPDKVQVANERRKSPRVPLRQRVIMVFEQTVYRTFTLDASMDGLRLKHPVPKALAGRVVDCYLSSPDLKTGLHLRAVLVDGGEESVRLKFVEQNPKNFALLKKWLTSRDKIAA